MQYELKGTEKQGKGPIVVFVDNSGIDFTIEKYYLFIQQARV